MHPVHDFYDDVSTTAHVIAPFQGTYEHKIRKGLFGCYEGNEARHKIRGLSETPHKFRLNIGVLKRRVFKYIVQTHMEIPRICEAKMM